MKTTFYLKMPKSMAKKRKLFDKETKKFIKFSEKVDAMQERYNKLSKQFWADMKVELGKTTPHDFSNDTIGFDKKLRNLIKIYVK